MNNLSAFEDKLEMKFTDKDLLKQVFIHRSHLNENQGLGLDHNERLEFLGDAVLELIVTDYLYREYPNPEGELTNWRSSLVNWRILAGIGRDLGMNDFMKLSRGEARSEGRSRDVILANAMEALIGAIYLDAGYDAAKSFVDKYILVKLPEILKNKLFVDAKSKFQEASQDKHNTTPEYRVISESGPDHDKHFVMGAYLGDRLMGKGEGSNKQDAETMAATDALQNNEW